MSSGAVAAEPLFDVIVVGTGAGALVAALTAKARGLHVLVIEKADVIGGSSALSGGGVWAPNAPTLLRAGVRDDAAEIVDYMQAIAGDVVSDARILRYVEEVPRMMGFLDSQSEYLSSDAFEWEPRYADYRPDLGGADDGRCVWPRPIDRRVLGPDMTLIRSTSPRLHRMSLPSGTWMTTGEMIDLLSIRWGGWRSKRMLLAMSWRVTKARLFGTRIATHGNALIIRLWMACREHGVELWRQTPLRDLIQDDSGAVVGVRAERDGRTLDIGARHGVILASGGFDHNTELRNRYVPDGREEWCVGSPDNFGDGLLAGQAVGAAADIMDEAWWIPTVVFPEGSLFITVPDRQQPGHFIVNQAGKRFVNEAAPYSDFVHAQNEGHRTGVSHVPAWMILDHRAWSRNFYIGHIPGTPTPRALLEGGVLRRASTLEDLAEQIKVPSSELRATADRFNALVRQGHDDDFNRGDSAYDRIYGNQRLPNPCLEEVSQAPFYAIPFVPGDLGTNGGLLTDENARVLREDGSAIEGLYACGNVSASVMGHGYAGGGATLSPAMTFGYVAANDVASRARGGGAVRLAPAPASA